MTGFDSKRQAAQAKLDDDADTLTIVYQQGFADGKRSAQRKPLSDEEILNIHALRCWPRIMFADKSYGIALDTVTVKDFTRAVEAAHNIKEGT